LSQSPNKCGWVDTSSNWKKLRLPARRYRIAFRQRPPYSFVHMELSSLSFEQFKQLVRGLVDDRLRELIGDPDLGLELGETLRARLQASLAKADRLSGEELADKLGLRW